METERYLSDKNPFGNKINKIINQNLLSDENLIESLKTISESYKHNTVRSRRNLRDSIEKQRYNIAEFLYNDMSSFKNNLDSLSSELDSMLNSCHTINAKLQTSKLRMEELVNQTNVTQMKKKSLTLTKLASDAILNSFYIAPDEWLLLNDAVMSKNAESLLKRLNRAKHIREQFVTSMAVPSAPLSQDIIKAGNTYIDKAYECLYSWIKREFSAQCFEAVEISIHFRHCLKELQERPILFKYVLDEYANGRRNVVADAFITALTVGWISGSSMNSPTTKPIEMQSHDPIRYAGDMLAWLHQTTASEKEYLRSLTSDKIDMDMAQDCLNNITHGLAYPFQLRLEQLLITEHNAVMLYKVNNLLQYYSSVIMNLLGTKSNLYLTLSELLQLSWNMFIGALQQQASILLTDNEFPRHDLMPSLSAMEVTRLLEAILTCQDMSCSLPDVRQAKCEQIAAVLVDSLLQHFESMAARFGELSSPSNDSPSTHQSRETTLTTEAQVYLINCLLSLHASLSRLEYTSTQLEQLSARIEKLLMELTREQVIQVLARTNLRGVHAALEQGHRPDEHGPLSIRTDLPEAGVSEAELINTVSRFNSYLANPDSMDLPELASIAFPRSRNIVRKKAADLIHSIYTQIYACLMDPANGYDLVQSLKTPEQVAELILSA